GLAAHRRPGATRLPGGQDRRLLPRGEARRTGAQPGPVPARAHARVDHLAAVLAKLVVGDVAQDARGTADDELARRDVPRDDGARPDERLLADLDAGTQDGSAADPRAAANRRSLHQRPAFLGPAHVVVVRRDDARRDEHVLLERGVRGDVRLRLDACSRADSAVVLDQRAAAENAVVGELDALADARLVADDA